MSNQLNLPRWTPIKLYYHLKDDQWKQVHLSSILSVTAKGVNTYVHVILFSPFEDFKQTSFTLSLWGIVCRILRKIMN